MHAGEICWIRPTEAGRLALYRRTTLQVHEVSAADDHMTPCVNEPSLFFSTVQLILRENNNCLLCSGVSEV